MILRSWKASTSLFVEVYTGFTDYSMSIMHWTNSIASILASYKNYRSRISRTASYIPLSTMTSSELLSSLISLQSILKQYFA